MARINNLMDVINEGKTPPPCDETLGINVEYVKDRTARGTWYASEKFVNGNGVVMGGFVSAAADTMMAYAISYHLDDDQIFSSINLDTTFHRPAFKGIVDVEVRIQKLGRNIVNLTANL